MAFLTDLIDIIIPKTAFAAEEDSQAPSELPAPGTEESTPTDENVDPSEQEETPVESKEGEEKAKNDNSDNADQEPVNEPEPEAEPENNGGEQEKGDENNDNDSNEDNNEEEEDEEEDEEEEEEVGDQLDKLRSECKEAEEGKPLVHHYMECIERVQKAQEQPGYEEVAHKEDCVEEFFHLQHYLDECTGPRLFDYLK